MLTFLQPWFFYVGIAAAAGPVIIHLLNRRRFRTVKWAAMDFLRQAMQRNRRLLQWRDLLLLLLRTACVLLFCLAMARPYMSYSEGSQDPDQPLHAVLMVDNSLSMGYQSLDRTLLDSAKAKAREFIEQLPQESRVTIIPVCGSSGRVSRDAYRSPDAALEALDFVEVLDREANVSVAADMAFTACQQEKDLPSKRVAFIGDQQQISWPAEGADTNFKQLPDVQIVPIQAAAGASNTWISEFKIRDGIADVETDTVFVVHLRHEGDAPREDVDVKLTLDRGTGEDEEELLASTIVDLEPGQTRELTFRYRFDVPVEPGRPNFQAVSVSVTPDDLPEDDRRFLSVPVVAALPVVFVDQFGEDQEEPDKNLYGDTFLLRRLLVPVRERGEFVQHLVSIRHVNLETLLQERETILKDCRLVVVAGVERPGPAVDLLREYVEQGGQLVIGVGDEFNPAAWNEEAWLDGKGILPAPLEAEPVGQLPDEAVAQLEPFKLDFRTMQHPYFQIEGEAKQSLKDLYESPYFFKAIAAEVTPAIQQQAIENEQKRIATQREKRRELQKKLDRLKAADQKRELSEAEREERDRLELELAELVPKWLLWARNRFNEQDEIAPEELAAFSRPQVLASFTNGVPYVVERQIGRGSTVFVSSGVFGSWNTLMNLSDAVVLFDRILRSKLRTTLPEYTREGVNHVLLPVEPADRRARFELARPGEDPKPLRLDALGADSYGLTVHPITTRGHYWVIARPPESGESDSESILWKIPLAVNGPEYESNLVALNEAEVHERLGDVKYRWISAGEPISLEGSLVAGQNLWKYLMFFVLVGLLAELGLLAWTAQRRRQAA